MPANETCVCSLSAASARSEDSGEWRCELVNQHGKSAATCSVRVSGETQTKSGDTGNADFPTFTETLTNVITEIKDNAELVCKTDPAKFVQVKWFRNDLPLDDGTIDRYKTSNLKGVMKLSIIRAKVKDSGIFKCRIQNEVGWTSCDAKLLVKESDDELNHELKLYAKCKKINEIQHTKSLAAIEAEANALISNFADTAALQRFLIKWQKQNDSKLQFLIHLKNRCVVEGCKTVMGCLVTGERPYTVRWYRGSEELIEGGKYFMDDKNGILTLTINRLKEEDTGNYTCTVRNLQEKMGTTCYLQVELYRDVSVDLPIKPNFILPLKRMTVNEGETIWLKVHVKAYPAPGFKWFKDGLELQESERIQMEVLPKGRMAQLVISMATTRDIGLYSCEVHNLAGRCKSMVRISVRDKYEEELWRASMANEATTENGTEVNGINAVNKVSSTTSTVSTTSLYSTKLENGHIEQQPVFKAQLPKSLRIDGRSRFLLEMHCDGFPAPDVQWFRNGTLLESSNRYNCLRLGNLFGLEVLDPSPLDAGSYTIKAVNGIGKVASTCEVEMELPTTKEQTIQSVSMETLDSLSNVTVMQVAGVTETEGDKFGIAEIIPSFHLCNTEADWTTNLEKEVEIIDADEAPSFPHGLPESLSPHVNDENIHLECQIRGEPIPTIVWLKDGEELCETDNLVFKMDPKTRIASLHIKLASLDDSGKYSCVAYGDANGHATTTSNVQVLPLELTKVDEECEVSSGKRSEPKFKVQIKNGVYEEDNEVKLQCTVEGFPVPKVKWYKDDVLIKATVGKYTITSSAAGVHSLTITGVLMSDSDKYKCEAINECGSTKTSATIVVNEKPEPSGVILDTPHFAVSLHNFTFNNGETAMLRCVAKGDPVPKLTWLKNGKPIVADDRVEVEGNKGEGIVTIKKLTLEDAGKYTCVAENDKGTAESIGIMTNSDAVEAGKFMFDDSLEEVEDSFTTTTQSESKSTQGTTTVETASTTVTSKSSSSKSSVSSTTTTSVSGSDGENSVDKSKIPKIVSQPLTRWLASGEPLQLAVEVTKCPDLTINWFHNDKAIDTAQYTVTTEDVKT